MTVQATPSKTSEAPAHPLLSDWAINRRLKKLEQNYRRDQEKKPTEIASSSKRLRQYAEEIEGVYEAEIESGRVADTADLWVGVYSQKILPLVAPKIGSLLWNLGHRMRLTGGGAPGEQASFEEAQRELSRLRAEFDLKLASACERAEQAMPAEKTGETHETVKTSFGPGRGSRVELGRWADARLEEACRFTRMLRGGKSPESLRPQFGTLFTEVIDRLPEPTRVRLFEDAQGRLMRAPDLMDWIANVKELSGSTLADYRKEYRREMGTARKRRPVGATKAQQHHARRKNS